MVSEETMSSSKFFDVETGRQNDRPRTTVWGLVLFRSLKQLKNVLNVGL